MQYGCRMLTRADLPLIPEYTQLFREGVSNIGLEIGVCKINATEIIDFEIDMLRHLTASTNVRYHAHFSNGELDGQLVEELKGIKAKNLDIKWIMAKYRRKGIGTELIVDCLQRARKENATMVTMAVGDWNKPALEFYQSIGFEKYCTYPKDRMIGMRRILNQNLLNEL